MANWIAGGVAAQAMLIAGLMAVTAHGQDAVMGNSGAFDAVLAEAETLDPIESLHVSLGGETVLAHGFGGSDPDAPHNIKSASKSIISALVGIAIARGVLEGVDQPIAPLLADALPEDPDPRLEEVTVGHLLSMQAGLTRTSNQYYAAWVSSPNWVDYALAQPFAEDPGTGWQYSTGSTHLLSAILTRETGRTTLELARDWLGAIPGFAIASWDRDPQGIYFGGNNMAVTPAALLAFGEIYARGGTTADGVEVIDPAWIESSWTERARSRLNGNAYGYGWFLTEIADAPVRFGWGYGGQMLYVVPSLDLVVVVTSDENSPSAGTGYLEALEGVLEEIIVLARAEEGEEGAP